MCRIILGIVLVLEEWWEEVPWYVWHLWKMVCVQRAIWKLIHTIPLAAVLTSTLTKYTENSPVYLCNAGKVLIITSLQIPSVYLWCLSHLNLRFSGLWTLRFQVQISITVEVPRFVKPYRFSAPVEISTIPKSYSVHSENCILGAFSDPAFKWLICTTFC